MFTKAYLVPDYYSRFACKCGACRTSCCRGWDVSLSMREYYQLLGMDCSSALRRRLDVAMHPLDSGVSEIRFAQIVRSYDGGCPMQDADGLCALQKECGEDVLPAVCRMYPRGPRFFPEYECSCANSCEGVVEMLLARQEPIRFEIATLTFPLEMRPESGASGDSAELLNKRREAIEILQNRELSLPDRLLSLGQSVASIDWTQGTPLEEREVLLARAEMARLFEKDSPSLRFIEENQGVLFAETGEDCLSYHFAQSRLFQELPDWQIGFEQLLVNHAFFLCFPDEEKRACPSDAFLALCAVYMLLIHFAVSAMAAGVDRNTFIDVVAALFRLTEHSNFGTRAAAFLREKGLDQPGCLLSLIGASSQPPASLPRPA